MDAQIKKRVGLTAFIFLALVPLVIWISITPLSQRFLNLNTTLGSFAQVAALVGVVMFALTIVLSARFKFLEDYFDGLPRMYVIHHYFGSIAFVLLLVHPLFSAGRYLLTSLSSAVNLLIPGSDWALNFGIFAILIMTVVIILTLYVRLPYQVWKFTHKFMGLAFFLGTLHALLITSDISRNNFLRLYISLFLMIGIWSFIYWSLLRTKLTEKFEYEIKSVRELDKKIVEVSMSPKGKKLEFVPGQFIFVSFKTLPEYHPFTISSSPSEKELRISVKALGDYTSQLRHLKPGTPVTIEGPHGRLTYQNADFKKQIWVAGGIGITPFLSMARHLRKKGNKEYEIDFYYTVPEKKDGVFLDEIKKISSEIKGVQIIPWFTREKGRITGEKIKEHSGLSGKDVFLCCPSAMTKDLKRQLLSSKLPRSRIHYEVFKL